MKIKAIGKLTLLIIGLLPIIAWIFLITAVGNGVYTKDVLPMTLGWAGFVSIPLLAIFYVINVSRNTKVARNQRILWSIILICANFVAFPFYWYLYIWRQSENRHYIPDTGKNNKEMP